jgi:hypothetical protein
MELDKYEKSNKAPKYCSIFSKNNGTLETCFDRNSLLTLIKGYNSSSSIEKKIRLSKNRKTEELLNDFKNVLPYNFKNNDQYWIYFVHSIASNTYKKKIMDLEKFFVPERPEIWEIYKNTWLSNIDIQKVMKQYHALKKLKYHFHGVFPIDFSLKDNKGMCLFNALCHINIKALIDKGIKYVGFITNLDTHDKSGSHWTSTFIIIDDTLPNFGAYYYDSIGRKIPKLILNFIKDIDKQLTKKLVIKENLKRHQFQNTECGMFALFYQIKWLELLQKNKATSFKDIVDCDLNDNNITILRDIIFRPKIKYV